MNVLITGGCGFLGAQLARALLARGTLSLAADLRFDDLILAYARENPDAVRLPLRGGPR